MTAPQPLPQTDPMRSLAISATLLLALTACGSDSDEPAADKSTAVPTSTSAPAETTAPVETVTVTETAEPESEDDPLGGIPSCADVFVVGKVLDKEYEGCQDKDGSLVPVLVYDDCDNGKTFLRIGDDFGAYEGGKVSDDPDGLFNECFGY